MYKYWLLLLVLSPILTPTLWAAPSWLFWPADAMVRISRQAAPKPMDTIQLEGAMGETVGCQVVLTGVKPQLLSCKLGIANTVPGVHIVALRQHYVSIKNSSPNAPFPPGEFPDALVPANSVVAAGLIDSPGLQNQPFWIDIAITHAAAPGKYALTLTATDGAANRQIPIELTVWPVKMPRKPTLASSVGLLWRRVAALHSLPQLLESTELRETVEHYLTLLSSHSLSASEPFPPHIELGADKRLSKIDLAAYQQYIQTHKPTTLRLPIWSEWPFEAPLGRDRELAQQYLADVTNALSEKGWEQLLYVDCPVDEPATAKDFAITRNWGQFLRETEKKHKISLRQLTTASPTLEQLHGAVDVWAMHVNDFWQDIATPQPLFRQRQKAGDEIWLYTSMSGYSTAFHEQHRTKEPPLALTEDHPFMWCIDFDPHNFRLPGWMCAKYKLRGLLYWDSLHWEEGADPWQQAAVFREGENVFNGDGQLIYPPSQFSELPCASLRLKWIRLGIQDHDLIQLALLAHKTEQVSSILEGICRSPVRWKADPGGIFKARAALAALAAVRPAR